MHLSPSAIKAFFNIMEKWTIKDADARDLLGGVALGGYAYEGMRRLYDTETYSEKIQ